jgi:N6-L-threonylcarbamoyladenine synthase
MNDIAASYQSAVVDVLITKLKNALELTAINTCVIAGGVSANTILRESAIIHLAPAKVHFSSLPLCTDNAAMVAYLGELKLITSENSSLSFPVLPNLSLT